jgi:hypothetical protein
MGDVGRNVETEQLDRDQAPGVGLIGAKDGAEDARTDLVQDAERAESVRRRGAGCVRVQRGYSSRAGSAS